MEKLKRIVSEIAYSHDFSKLPLLHRSFIPLLSMLSSLYNLSVTTRHHLYFLGIFRKKRLPVPVISVGNLTWGGNGKTPMVEFLCHWFSNSGISPLILSRGYAGGDEVKMLERHLLGTSAKVGVGANRALSATLFLEKYGYTDSRVNGFFDNLLLVNKVGTDVPSDKIGVTILDDGMQLGPSHVDQLHYSDHYLFHSKDIYVMTRRLRELYHKFGSRPIVVTTEKDYDRDSEILSQLHPFDVLVLCSQLQLFSYNGSSENKFKELIKQLLDSRSGKHKRSG